MQQDMKEFQGSGAGFEGADGLTEQLAQIKADPHKPQIGTASHEAHIDRKLEEQGVNKPLYLSKAEDGLAKIKAETAEAQAVAEVAATTADEPGAGQKAEQGDNLGHNLVIRPASEAAAHSTSTRPPATESKLPEEAPEATLSPEPAKKPDSRSEVSSSPKPANLDRLKDMTMRTEYGAPEPERQRVARFEIKGRTEKNYHKSPDNQDVILEDSTRGLMAVFDGMGGHAEGRRAAEIARNVFEDSFSTTEFKPPSQESKEKYGDTATAYAAEEMTRALERANKDILDSGTGGGTTAAVVVGFEDAEGQAKAVIGHVGDSRVYRLTTDGKLEHLTLDDSKAIEDVANARKITPQEAQQFLAATSDRKDIPGDLHVITGALGKGEELEPHVNIVDVNPGDVIFATSDGIHDNLTDDKIQEIIERSADPQQAVDRLNQAAAEMSQLSLTRSKDDDRSVVMMDIKGGGESQQEGESTITKSGAEDSTGAEIPVQSAEGSAGEGNNVEANEPDEHPRTFEYDGQKVVWTQRREDFLNSEAYTEEQKQNNLVLYQKSDRDSIARGEVDEETLAELGIDPARQPEVAEGEKTDDPETAPAPEAEDGAGPDHEPPLNFDAEAGDEDEAAPGNIPHGTFEADDEPDTPPETETSVTTDDESEPDPEAEAQEVAWEAHVRSAQEALADIHDMLGRAFREGMSAVEQWAESVYNLNADRLTRFYHNWRNNSRRRSERYRERLAQDRRPDTKWQRMRLGMKERSEQRRAAFWDKWLGTRIGQEEEERPGEEPDRQHLVNRPEEGMDRAIRLLANLRNDQERFRGIRLTRGREKVRQIEDDFRELANQEVADKVEERLAESPQDTSPEEIQAVVVSSILDIMQHVDQAQAETKSTRRKNDGKIHEFLSSPGWKKTTGTIIAGAGTVGVIFGSPVAAAMAVGGIFAARQAGMRERVDNKTNKKAGKQAALIDRMTEDPLMRELYRRLDVTPQSRGGEVEDLPVRGRHIGRDDVENYNARELVEALGREEVLSDDEHRAAVTEQIIDSLLLTSRERARTKLHRRLRSTAFSAGASTLPLVPTGVAVAGLGMGGWISHSLLTLGGAAVPLIGAWRPRRAYAPPASSR